MRTTIWQKLLIFALIVIGGNLYIGTAVYKSNQKLIKSDYLVQHTEDLISKLSSILALGKDIESASRGFIITNDSSILEPLFVAEETIFQEIGQLRQSFQGNPTQQQRVDSIYYYMQKRVDFSLKQVEIRSKHGLEAAISYSLIYQGQYYSDQLRHIASAIEQDEASLLLQREQSNKRSTAKFNWLYTIMYILMTIITILLFFSISKILLQNKKRELRANELIIANTELAFQNKEKENRAAELIIANTELAFQNIEKGKRAAELIVANTELAFQNKEKELRADELIVAKEKAEESDRLKSAFLANMSHEIRTPLNGILGFTELLKEPENTDEQQKYFISIIEMSGARLLNIINDIMSISKIESGQMGIKVSKVDVNKQMTDIYNFFNHEAALKGIQLYCSNKMQTPNISINSDSEKINSILTNLVKNAIKFTEKGTIEIGFDSIKPAPPNNNILQGVQNSGELKFFVKDTGIGIRPEQLKLVFERFRQGNETHSKKYEGAGLGLSISKAFVEMLGGKIWADSEPGTGSTIYFTLPLHACPA